MNSSDIQLIPFKKEHYKCFFKLIKNNHAYLKRYLGWLDYVSKEQDTLSFITEVNELMEKGQALQYYITLNQEIIGTIALREIDNNAGIIGFWLAESYANSGVMSHTVQLFIDHCKKFGIKKIILRAQPANIASNKIAIKNNFKFIQLLKNAEILYGRAYDLNYYELDLTN